MLCFECIFFRIEGATKTNPIPHNGECCFNPVRVRVDRFHTCGRWVSKTYGMTYIEMLKGQIKAEKEAEGE